MSDYYSNDIKQTHTIIFPPPNFTMSTIVSQQNRLQKKVVMRKSHDEPKHKQLLNINIYRRCIVSFTQTQNTIKLK